LVVRGVRIIRWIFGGKIRGILESPCVGPDFSRSIFKKNYLCADL
jgi:hypothetical protein